MVYGDVIISKEDGNIDEAGIKEVRRILKETEIGMDIDNYSY